MTEVLDCFEVVLGVGKCFARSCDSQPNWPIYLHTAPSTLSSTNVLITACWWSRQHRIYAWLVRVSRDGKAMTYWGGGNYTPYMCLLRCISVLWQPRPARPPKPGKNALGTTLALWMQLCTKRLCLAGEQRTAYK